MHGISDESAIKVIKTLDLVKDNILISFCPHLYTFPDIIFNS